VDQPAADDRLSHISTAWTMIFQAHGGQMDAAALAQAVLLQRYSGAVFRYLLGAVRDSDAAAELAQEFALRFVRGDFRRADPERGRFRDYLKTSLSRLVADHFRARKRQGLPLADGVPDPATAAPEDLDREFIASWRAELLERTWRALAAANASYHALLLLRIDQPNAASADLAEQLSGRWEKPVNAAWVRKTLQRAHENFTDLLLDEVAYSIDTADKERLREELDALDLLKYCRAGLERRGT
jgi:DNA-directed RNA polymerase specialized sigma24 family protein